MSDGTETKDTGPTGGEPIALTEHEERIFAVLLAASAEAFAGRTVVLRVAGGWVRDKLLGRPSHDIDIAIDCMPGAEFAAAVRTFVDAHTPGAKETKIAVIKQNPEQSKHLETATMTVLGLPIDFVNLRAEEYSKTSRIPTIVCVAIITVPPSPSPSPCSCSSPPDTHRGLGHHQRTRTGAT